MNKPDRRHPLKDLITSLSLILLLSSIGWGQSLSVQSPSDSLTVGSTFDFSITVNSQSDYEKAIFPDSAFFSGDIEWVSSKQFRISESSDSTEYQLQFFGIQDAIISPLPVYIVSDGDTTTLFTEPVQLFYKQTIASEEDSLKPLKPIFDFSRLIWPYLLALLIIGLIAFLIWYKYFKDKPVEQIEQKPIPVFLNPLDELENRLTQLKTDHEQAIEKDYKEFYSRLGDSIRWYVEEVYNIPALESTTREVLRYMDAFGADVELIKHTRKVLNEADMAKFAKFKPTLDQSWSAYREGETFYERAKVIDNDRISRKKADFLREQNVVNEEVVHGVG